MNKISAKRTILIIIIALLLCAALIILSNASDPEENSPDNIPIEQIKQSPDFTKEGELIFTDDSNSQPIKTINIEIADTSPERSTGLMYRKTLFETEGMLFIFDKPTTQSFYMKNTYIPLDIIFVNENNQIVTIHKDTEPLSLESLVPDEDSLYVVEVNSGFSDKYGINVGDLISYTHD